VPHARLGGETTALRIRFVKELRAAWSGPVGILPRDGAGFKGSFWPGGRGGNSEGGIRKSEGGDR